MDIEQMIKVASIISDRELNTWSISDQIGKTPARDIRNIDGAG